MSVLRSCGGVRVSSTPVSGGHLQSRSLIGGTTVRLLVGPDGGKIKVAQFKSLPNDEGREKKPQLVKLEKNSVKLENNIARAKRTIFELAYCNPWDYFFTGTLSPALYERTDLVKAHKDLTQWLQNQGKKYHCKIDFLLVPELHQDGESWHFHGLMRGIPDECLIPFFENQKLPMSILEKLKKGDPVYNWPAYGAKFGFVSLEKVKNHEAVAKYITKYINKNLAHSVTEVGAHLYYHSRGLSMGYTIKKGVLLADSTPFKFQWENDFCKLATFELNSKNLDMILASFESYDSTAYPDLQLFKQKLTNHTMPSAHPLPTAGGNQ